MASKVKNIKQSNNILYLQDSDAKALGIIEGASQRVFIDNREVEVVFVDEHEVLPVSNEEKKLYEDAYKIASKYVENSVENSTPTSRSLVQRSGKYKEPRPIRQDRVPGEGFSFKKQWNNFVGMFRREPGEREHQGPSNRDMVLAERAARREEREYIEARNQQKRHARHSIRNDIFTEEELEIIQNVIDKSKHPSSSKVKSKKK